MKRLTRCGPGWARDARGIKFLARINLAILRLHASTAVPRPDNRSIPPAFGRACTLSKTTGELVGNPRRISEIPSHRKFRAAGVAEQIEERQPGELQGHGLNRVRAAESLTDVQKRAALRRAFQVNDLALNRPGRDSRILPRRCVRPGPEASVAHWNCARLARFAIALAARVDGRRVSRQGSRRS